VRFGHGERRGSKHYGNDFENQTLSQAGSEKGRISRLTVPPRLNGRGYVGAATKSHLVAVPIEARSDFTPGIESEYHRQPADAPGAMGRLSWDAAPRRV
jgi:hypothetical protein